MSIRPIAIHLPQFHPFTENDEWWGKGFTEWTNVAKAKPQFKGHYQPHLPADLGFYDLRLEEARIAQASLAKEYGIHGFCYYHYWFNGKRLMQRPLDDMLQTKTPDFPFMLCWANENWTRRWDGEDKEILIQQTYSLPDDIEHINFLLTNFFNDERYIRVDGKPFFVVYKPNLFPDIRQTITTWRAEAEKVGVKLHLGYMKTASFNPENDRHGFDCAIEFQPEFFDMPVQDFPPFIDKLKHRLNIKRTPFYTNYITSYPGYVDRMLARPFNYDLSCYPGITPGWDNSPRRRNGAILYTNSSPEEYSRWLKHIARNYQGKNTFLFINAWNEWAEGNHLEPCQKWGTQYLEATKSVLADNSY